MINYKHVEYEFYEKDYEMIEDILEGERTIKSEGVKYLPMLGGQNPVEYGSYKDRGKFYNVFDRTIQGMVGSMLRKVPEVIVPDELIPILPNITVDGKSFDELVRITCVNVLAYGRLGLLVDKFGDINSNPYIALYKAQDILNWKTEIIDGKEKLTMLVLQEVLYESSNGNEFDLDEVFQLRIFKLISSESFNKKKKKKKDNTEERKDILEVTVMKSSNEAGGFTIYEEPVYPKILGVYLDYIPFVFIGAIDNGVEPNKPPLLDLANLNIYHWKLSVDHAHGLHYTALPTPWAAGFDDKKELYIGPTHAWVSRDPASRCGYLEFTGEGLRAIVEELDRTERQMSALGAQMIEKTRKGIESAETARLRQISESASLLTISGTVSDGLTAALKLVEKWMTISDEKTRVVLTKDFVADKITSQEITALLNTLLSNKISLDTFLYNLKEGEVLPPYINVSEEIERIEEDYKRKIEMEEKYGVPEEEKNLEPTKTTKEAPEDQAITPDEQEQNIE